MMRKLGLGTAVIAAALIVGGVAYATIPDGGGVIHSCYARSGGSLRVIDAGVTNCKSGETSLNWNQTGPAGAAGPAGAKGDTGAAGPAGPQESRAIAAIRAPPGPPVPRARQV